MMIRKSYLLCFVIAGLIPALLFGQSFTAAIRGLITDASQAAVPGARVVVTDVDRNIEHSTVADALGRYVLTALPPGTYRLSVEASGFQKHSRSSFTLQVQQQATIDVELQVGQLASVVEVQESAPLLNTTIANLGQVIDNRFINQLPLINRNIFALTYLTPGVVGAAGAYNASESTNFSAVGTRNSTADIILDGVSITTPEQNSGITTLAQNPSVDAVEEFKVQTSFFSAEFGNTGGAIVNMVTKSGTNQFHGSGYWFYRHDSLNANSFFSNRAGRAKPSYHRHLYGGTAGGPIKRDKTFFFYSYERLPEGSPYSQTATFPTAQQRQGDFSDYVTPSRQPISIYNPFDTFTNAAGEIKRRPFPGNVIPKSMLNPISMTAASYYPAPNQPGLVNNWFEQGIATSVNYQMEIKADHNFREKNRISARYSPRRSRFARPNVFGEGSPGLPWEIKRTLIDANNAVLDYTRAHSAQTIFNVRFGLLNPNYYSTQLVYFDLKKLGLPAYIEEAALKINPNAKLFPQFQPEGYTAIGDAGFTAIGRETGSKQVIGSVMRIAGGHNLKIGGEYRRNFLNYNQPGYPAGSFSFNRQITSEDRFAGSSTQGNGFASMLLGWGSGSRFDHTPWSYNTNEYYGGYVQDDWKLTRKLTLNLGLRYDLERPHWERAYRESYWNLTDPSPLNGKVPGYDLRGFFMFTDEKTPSPFDGDHKNFQPRVGFAYAIDDKTSIRAGYGLFFTLSRATLKGTLGAGFNSQSSVEWSRDSNITQYATLSNPYPDGLNLPPGRSQGPMTFIGLGASTIVRENIKPSYHMWNFSIQRQLMGPSLVEVNYTGTKGSHQYVPYTSLSNLDPVYWGIGRTELNRLVPNPFYGVITDPRSPLSAATIQRYRLLRPFPQYNGASRGGSEPPRGDTIYNSLQLKFERRFSHGLSALAHYTISKSIDDVADGSSSWDWLGGSAAMQDMFKLRNERSLSISDIPQRTVLTFSYELPIGTGKAVGNGWGRLPDALAGGWQISGFLTFQSGVPLSVSQSGGTLWAGTQRPNLVGDPNPGGSVVKRLDAYFNPAAFQRPVPDVLGTAARTLNYRVPGIRNAEMALLKSFAIREQMRGEFRFELQNATNTPSFGFPSSSFGSTSFGTITGYKGGLGPRQAQIGLKFYL